LSGRMELSSKALVGPFPFWPRRWRVSAFKAGGGVIPRDTTFLRRLVLSGTHQT
jgi:hypothetical protein